MPFIGRHSRALVCAAAIGCSSGRAQSPRPLPPVSPCQAREVAEAQTSPWILPERGRCGIGGYAETGSKLLLGVNAPPFFLGERTERVRLSSYTVSGVFVADLAAQKGSLKNTMAERSTPLTSYEASLLKTGCFGSAFLHLNPNQNVHGPHEAVIVAIEVRTGTLYKAVVGDLFECRSSVESTFCRCAVPLVDAARRTTRA